MNEISWANKAGFCKNVEQMELIEEQAFRNGRAEMYAEAQKGLCESLYAKKRVKELIEKAVASHDKATIISLKRIQSKKELDALIKELEGGSE